MLERENSSSELPPITARSPFHSTSYRPGHISIDPTLSGITTIKHGSRKSLLSPSTASTASNKSVRMSPAGIQKRVWTADLNSSQSHESAKLETVYEDSSRRLSNVKLEDIHKGKSLKRQTTQTILTILEETAPNAGSNTLSITSHKSETLLPKLDSSPQLTVNRLSSENLKKLLESSTSRNMNINDKPSSREPANRYDSDEEKEKMIKNWLIGVEKSQGGEPQDVSAINPTEKRDTAIHVIYKGN